MKKRLFSIMRDAACCLLLLGICLLLPQTGNAAITVTDVTPTNVTVEPGDTIPATVEVTLTNGSDWRSTEWRFSPTNAGAFTCQNTANFNSNGTHSISLNLTAPTAAGVYNLYFRADSANFCGGTNSATYLAGTVTVPGVSVVSIDRAAASPTTAGTVTWTVVFSRAVTGVTVPDFALVNNGLGGTPAITSVTGSGTTWTVNASTGTGSGTLGLNVVDNDSIQDAWGNRLGGNGTGNGNFIGQIYTIDRTAPAVTSIVRAGADPTGAASVSWIVTFSESVTGVGTADFVLANTGLSGPAITSVTGSGNTYTVTATTGTGNGTLGLNLADDDSIVDVVANRLGGTGAGNGNFTGEIYTIDKSAPVLLNANSICGLNQVMVSFSEALNASSAQTSGNYAISGGVMVTSATLLADGKTVLLQASAMNAGAYTLTVSNVRDIALNPVAAASQINFTHTGGTLTQGMRGLYYGQNGVQRAYFTGTPVERIDATIDFNWANGIPVAGIAADDFTVRWTGFVRPPVTGSYELRTRSDDGVRLYLNGEAIVDNWTDHGATDDTSAPVNLSANRYYPIQMDFYERGGQAEARLSGSYAGGGFSIVPSAYLFYCSVPVSATPGAFNAFESSTAANQTSGVIKTKIAGTGFSLDLIALNAAKDAVLTGFAGDVKLELVSNNAAPGTGTDATTNCPLSLAVLSTSSATFVAGDNGRKANVSFAAVPDVWRDVRVRLSYPATGTPTVVSCSNDNFAIRPASLGAIVASDLNWNSAGTARTLNNTAVSAGTVHKAGRPFRIAATAYNSANNVTSNYQGNPMATVTSCLGTLGNASSCTAILGNLNLGGWGAAASPANGTVVTGTASYSEVGSFHLQLRDEEFAFIDDKPGGTDSSAAERHVPLSASFAIGRFVPDHFVVSTVNTPQFKTFNDTTCPTRSFTYIGQKFGYVTPPVALVTARNAANQPTRNYQGRAGQGNHLWKLSAGDVAQTYASVSSTLNTPQIGTVVITPKNDDSGTGEIAINAGDTLSYKRETTAPLAPQAAFNGNISLTINVVDASETSGASPAETINTMTSAVFGASGGIAFDDGSEFRYGILKLSNAHGSELLKLPVGLEAQYWNGTRFVTNTADHCTRFDGINVSLSNFQKNLNACETDVPASGRLASGRGNFVLAAPGAGNNGSVDLRINLSSASGSACIPSNTSALATSAEQDYLAVKVGAAYTGDPSARATFGVRKSGPVIYLREMY